MLQLSSSPKVELGSYIISFAKTAYKKFRALICSMKYLSPEVVSMILAYSLAWNTVVISGLVHLAPTWK